MSEPVLLVSPYFLPRKRVGALRAAKFVKYLGHYGFEPHIASLDAGLPGQRICRIVTPVDRTMRTSGSALGNGTTRTNTGPGNDTGQPQRGGGVSDAGQPPSGVGPSAAAPDRLNVVDQLFPVDSWLPVMWWNRRKVLNYARQHGIRLVWSTGDPWSGHLIASHVSRSLNIPWIADWRDPWTLCAVRSRGRAAWVRRLDARAERAWMLQATHNTFTAEETMRRYQQAYGIPATTIYNAFDQTLERTEPTANATPAPHDGMVELVFFGRFRQLSPAEPVIRLVAACSDPKRVKVVSFGSMPEADRQLAHTLGVAECFVTEEPIPYDQAAARLRRADLLLLSTDPRRDDIIPAKLWDYLPMGRPILSLAPNPEVSRILQETRTSLDADPLTILNRYLAEPEAWRRQLLSPDFDRIATFSAEQATRRLSELMTSLIHD
jgi:hypothetical protein